MADIFNDLSYGKKVVNPTLRPVDAMATMYETQNKKYEYATDNYNKSQTLLSNIPVDEQDKHIVMDAQQALDDELSSISERGDYENYALNSKQFTYDLANKYGLAAVQKKATQRASYAETVKKQIDDGDISSERGKKAIRDAERNTKSLVYDEELKRWEGSYASRSVAKQENQAEKLLKATDGFKATVLPFTGRNGEKLIKEPGGNGYVYSTSGEAVTEAELLEFSKTYLANDPQFQSELQDDIYFDIGDITGGERAMTVNDVTGVFPPRYLEEGRKMFGLGEGDLTSELESKNISPEQFYSAIKAEEKMNLAARPAVLKESYEAYTDKFYKDYSADAMGGSNGMGTISSNGILDTYYSEDRTSVEDLVNRATVYNNASNDLKSLNKELQEIENSKTANPRLIQEKKDQIAEKERIVTATIDKHSRDIESVPEVKEEINSLVNGTSGIEGVSISYSSVQKLIYASIAGEDITAELAQFITVEEPKQTATVGGGYAVDRSEQQRATGKLSSSIIQMADKLTGAAKDNGIKYTESYATFNLAAMSSKDKMAHPAYQLNNYADNMSNQSSAFYRKMVNPGGLDVETYLKEEYDLDLEDEDQIHWDKATVRAGIDTAKDTKGTNRPVLPMTVPITKDGKTTMINTHTFVDEPSYNAAYYETIKTLKNQLLTKQANGGLNEAERISLSRYNANLFDSTKYGTTFPTNKLYNAKDGDIIEFDFMDNAEKAKIEVNTRGGANSLSYLLVDGEGDEKLYYATDKTGSQTLVTKEQLAPNERGQYDYTPIGGNTPYDLRVKMGEMTTNTGNTNSANTVNLTDIFKTDIKQGVIPKISASVAHYAQNLKTEFPELLVTDALRPQDAGYGATDSEHKTGKALDFRLNDDGRKLLDLSDREKRLFNIKSVGLHNGNHIHLEFL